MHAAWNALIKSGRDPLLDTALVALAGTVVALPLTLLVEAPAPASWPYICAYGGGAHRLLRRACRRLPPGRPVARLSDHARRCAAAGRAGERLLVRRAAVRRHLGRGAADLRRRAVARVRGEEQGQRRRQERGPQRRSGRSPAPPSSRSTRSSTAAGVRVSGGAERYVVWLFVFLGPALRPRGAGDEARRVPAPRAAALVARRRRRASCRACPTASRSGR